MQDKQLLKRTQKVGAGDNESSSSESSDSDLDDDADAVKRKALDKINAEMSQEESDGSEESDSDEEGFGQDFGDRKERVKKKAEGGIMNLKFMKNAEAKKREATNRQIKMAAEQVDDYEEDEEDVINVKGKFGEKDKMPIGEPEKKLEHDQVLKAARSLVGAKPEIEPK